MSETRDDLSAVAWVHEEVRRSLDAAHKALRRFLKELEALDHSDVDDVDPVVLRSARAQIHQGVGALELVGLAAPALLLRASESLVQRAIARPQTLTAAAIADIERSSFALLDYLARMLAGKPVSVLSLFPQYRAVQDAAEASRVHPADLWTLDWRWRELPDDPRATPVAPDASVHEVLEGELLTLMRSARPTAAAARISELCAGLGAGASNAEAATLWKLASAMFEAQAQGLLGFDLFTKRVASRLLAQFRILERGEAEVSERLAQDLLFFCAQSARPAPGQAPRLEAARSGYSLEDARPVDYSASVLGRFDPALVALAKKRVVAAKEAWSAVAGGEMHRLAGLTEQFSLVGDSLKRLFPFGEALAVELQQTVAQTQQASVSPPAPLAMEVATSLLFVEAALEDADFDDPEHAARVQRLAERLQQVRLQRSSEPLEAWMEELYRRVSDRQTMGSVVQELRASLAEAEKAIDQFFRNPVEHAVLFPVSQQLSTMRGVLSVLGMDHASAALLRMRDEIDHLAAAPGDARRDLQADAFERMAGNLSALGFLIDMLSVQPQLAKSLFIYDAQAGTLAPVMGRTADGGHGAAGAPGLAPQVEPRLIEQAQMLAFTSMRDDVPLQDVTRDLDRLSQEAQAADQPMLAAAVLKAREALGRAADEDEVATARGELSEALVDFVATASEPAAIEPQAAVAPREMPTPSVAISDFQEDDEMRQVFLEEAREVVGDAQAASRQLAGSPDDLGLATTLRRAYHTLKGSSRMVGLKDFGEAAWSCEQLYNSHLADQRAAEPALVEFTVWSLDYLGRWIEEIAERVPSTHDAATVQARAALLTRQAGPAGFERSDVTLSLGLPPDLPSASDLDLGGVPPEQAPAAAAFAAEASAADEGAGPVPAEVEPLEASVGGPAARELPFELDLSGLDRPSFSAGAASTPAQPHLDPKVQALFDPFDTEVLVPRALSAGKAGTDDVPSGPVDLDIGDEPAADPFIRPLRPSQSVGAERPPADPLAGLVLDFSTAAAGPADAPIDVPVELSPSATMALEASAVASGSPRAGDGEFVEARADRVLEAAEPSDPARAAGLEAVRADEESVKVVGPLRIGIPLFNIYLNEADELSRRLAIEVAEWTMELHRPIGEVPIALAHSLAGSSATIGFAALSHLARGLEHAQTRSQAIGHGTSEEAHLFLEVTEEIRRLLHQFAAGFLKEASPELLRRLAEHEVSSARRLEALNGVHAFDGADEREAQAEPTADTPGHAFESASALEVADLDPDRIDTSPARLDETVDPDEIDTTPASLDALAEDVASSPRTATALPPGGASDLAADAEGAAVSRRHPDRPTSAFGGLHGGDRPASVFGGLHGRDRPASVFAGLHGRDRPSSAFGSLHGPDRASSAFGGLHGRDRPRSAFGELQPLGVAELKPLAELSVESMKAEVPDGRNDAEDDVDAHDAVDAELFPIFEEEGLELIPQLAAQLRAWTRDPGTTAHAAACMRTLHTLKGGARLAGAMRLGEMAHRLETRIERILANSPVAEEDVEALQGRCDNLAQTLDALRAGRGAVSTAAGDDAARPLVVATPDPRGLRLEPDGRREQRAAPQASVAADAAAAGVHATDAMPHASASEEVGAEPESAVGGHAPATRAADVTAADVTPADAPAPVAPKAAAEPDRAAGDVATAPARPARVDSGPASAAPRELPPIDWSRFAVAAPALGRAAERGISASQSAVRVGAPLLDRLVNLAGEVSITRSRVAAGVEQMKASLADLTDNLERLRGQLRDIEIQGEMQMSSRLEAAKAAAQTFDPLEFDRFTRFQEITRMMAEAVNDVATVQRTLQRSIETTEDELVAQARMTRDLQDDLLRTRMVEFEGLSDRLYRVVRQAAKETGRQVRLDILGGTIEIDRGVLDRMTSSFEHLLRNCVTHGIEAPAARVAAGKEAAGSIIVALSHEGNEVGIEFRDDGAGLDLARIRQKGVEMGLLDADTVPSDLDLANLIFAPGFSTASSVTELAGRGVGMDVVRSEVVAMGGRIETATESGKGTSFKLILPLTTAVTQVVMLRCGDTTVAVPSTLVETVLRATPEQIEEAYASGTFVLRDKALLFFWLGALLQISARPADALGRTRSVVVVRSAQQRIAIHVDEVVGNQEVVVKNLGPQLSRLPGLAGMTLLASGAVALIYNPVALATLYGDDARAATAAALESTGSVPLTPEAEAAQAPAAPLILVVDDSLTVRRVTQRLLVREGYRVALAKDGLDALERLSEERPAIVLSDIEMPRMDGFDLVRNLRSDARWRALPVIMITSRIAQKHRDHAIELGVDHYLGKPYSEEDLLALIGRYTAQTARA
jgi:chemosensory pili system protein ChpA (sensor histidine kinase/response regulator)